MARRLEFGSCQTTKAGASYRGRLAPSPTGYLHLGHARTFWVAQERARAGTLVLRNEDLDPQRCKPEFVTAMLEDLRWFGLVWQEGPDCGGPFGPYRQSERTEVYRAALEKLRAAGAVYPCRCSRQDVLRAAQAPHAIDEEPIYPGTCRPNPNPQGRVPGFESLGSHQLTSNSKPGTRNAESGSTWRFRVPDGGLISFLDGGQGPQSFVAGRDFGDFVVWRGDDVPAYQLAVVVDDSAMQITEVVRGVDLLLSTARQILLYRALGLDPPSFYHCPLMTDAAGVRLAKRHDALSLRRLRRRRWLPEDIRRTWLTDGLAAP